MDNSFKKATILAACMTIFGCAAHSSHQNNAQGSTTSAMAATTVPAVVSQSGTDESVGGGIRASMDRFDKDKLAHALDKAPGKATSWENKMSGIHYTVVPTKVGNINGNPYCRHYHVTADTQTQTREATGIACVDGGAWKSIGAS